MAGRRGTSPQEVLVAPGGGRGSSDIRCGGRIRRTSRMLNVPRTVRCGRMAPSGKCGSSICTGLSCETVLRCAVLEHLHRETWGLEFALRDSASARRFVCADPARLPK